MASNHIPVCQLQHNSSNSCDDNQSILLADEAAEEQTDEQLTESDMRKNCRTIDVSARKSDLSTQSLKLALLVFMVFHNSAFVLVGRYSRTAPSSHSNNNADQNDNDLYSVNHLIMVTEIAKLLLSCVAEEQSDGGLRRSLRIHILQAPAAGLLVMSVPALLYLMQTSVIYVALENLTAPVFQVTYQFKLVTTALLSVLLLPGRSYNTRQWVCLVALSVGVAIVVLGEQKQLHEQDQDNRAEANFFLGLLAVTFVSFSSALAGVYFERVVKATTTNTATHTYRNKNSTPTKESIDESIHHSDDIKSLQSNTPTATDTTTNQANSDTKHTKDQSKPEPPSLWMRNIQLSFFSIVLAYCQNVYNNYGKENSTIAEKPYLHGFTVWVWMLVLLQATGGLLVAAIIKYADNVLKGLATGVSIVTATAISQLLQNYTESHQSPTNTSNTGLTSNFLLGTVLILCSVYYFSNPLPSSMYCNVSTHYFNPAFLPHRIFGNVASSLFPDKDKPPKPLASSGGSDDDCRNSDHSSFAPSSFRDKMAAADEESENLLMNGSNGSRKGHSRFRID